MSQEKLFQTTNSLDSRIADISPQLHYEVYHSGQESTTYRIKDDSGTSTSQMQFNFNSPGSASVIDRLMLVEATLQFKVNSLFGAAAEDIPTYGVDYCVANWPIHQMCSNATLTLNNAANNFDSQNDLNMLTRVMDQEDLRKWADYAPTMPDRYGSNTHKSKTVGGARVTKANSSWSGYEQLTDCFKPNGAFDYVESADDPAFAAANDATARTVTITVREPVMVQPCLLHHATGNNAGFVDISNLKLEMNLNAYNRALRAVMDATATVGPVVKSISLVSKTNANLYLRVLTPSVLNPIPKRNLLP